MNRSQQLDRYNQELQSIILSRQNPITGLFPASTAITAHGDYTDAWVRDNVYTILAVWGLALAYRKVDTPPAPAFRAELLLRDLGKFQPAGRKDGRSVWKGNSQHTGTQWLIVSNYFYRNRRH